MQGMTIRSSGSEQTQTQVEREANAVGNTDSEHQDDSSAWKVSYRRFAQESAYARKLGK